MRWHAVLVALCAACAVLQAQAHAFLKQAEPRVGSSVPASPPELKLWFDQPIEAAFSTVDVRDADGRSMQAGRARIDHKDRTLLHVALPALAPGRYTVAWRVVSVDTHVTQGDFVFHVGQ